MMLNRVTAIVVVPARVLATLRSRAAHARGRECCGALLGDARRGAITRAVAIPNAADPPRRAYAIRPRHLLTVERAAAAAGVAVLGFYHSHPGGRAVPSVSDQDGAWPGYFYFIIAAGTYAAAGDDLPAVAAWRLRDDRSGFDRLALRERP
jgi:desampylase